MEKIFDKESWSKFLRGRTIYDCAIIRERGFSFVLVEERPDRDIIPVTTFITMAIDRPMEQRFAVFSVVDFQFTTIASSMNPPEYVAVDTSSSVYSATALRKGEETPIDQLLDMTTYRGKIGVIKKMVRAAGQIYALGNYRRIYRRLGEEQWAELGSDDKGVPLPHDVRKNSDYSMDLGFADMSAFAADDMYAVGGKGDAWRFDGMLWHDCALPTKARLVTVCCGGNGVVYITELNGTVWAGREKTWTKVADADFAWGFQPVDAVWFNNRLYLGAKEGLWTLDESTGSVVELAEVERDAPNATNSGRLDISPDGAFLLTAGPHGACINDGTGWRRLFSTFDYL